MKDEYFQMSIGGGVVQILFTTLRVSLDDLINKRRSVFDNNLHIKAALDWLCLAQDKTRDGGVAAWYSLLTGWAPSYIETTGYIIDTFLDCAKYFKDDSLRVRAIKMADFILGMQNDNGGYRTHPLTKKPISEPTVFNTGQDLLGLTSIYLKTKKKKYLDSAVKAADFLCNIQELDGSWFKFTYGNKTHVYHTRVSWGLLKVYEITKESNYKRAAIKNLSWALNFQNKNGWFDNVQLPLPNPITPFTHTISYAIEGFLWSGILLKNKEFIKIAENGARPMLDYFLNYGFLPGTFNNSWQSIDKYSCLTGNAQVSLVWLNLYKETGEEKYLKGAKKMNNFLKSLQNTIIANKNINGAIKGSDPIYGDLIHLTGYCRMAYPNWATKFFIDALLLELQLEDK